MTLVFRDARREDVPAIITLLRDDDLGQGREDDDLEPYFDAFDRLAHEPGNAVVVGELTHQIVATYQITFISGLSLRAARRAQIESVRVGSNLRGQGYGHQLVADAEARARDAGCMLIQLTMNAVRSDSHRFYESCGFVASHVGLKKAL